jgi:chromosome partitioning protein
LKYLGDTAMIVIAGGIKGGSGKTTIATNLAIMRAAEGRDVLLVDADDQETATDFTNLRNERVGALYPHYTDIKLTGAALRTEILRLAPKYQDIIIDTGGRDTTSQRAALSVAHLLLVPFVPRSFDVWTLEKVGELVAEMRQANPGLRAFTFINRGDPRGADNNEAGEALRDSGELQFLDLTIGTRKAFGNAAAAGLAVTELKPEDPKASEEITQLMRYIFDTVEISQEYQKRGLIHGNHPQAKACPTERRGDRARAYQEGRQRPGTGSSAGDGLTACPCPITHSRRHAGPH